MADNNAALEAEETKSTEASEVADAQEETTENQGAAPASEETVSESTPENAPAEGAAEGESTSASEPAEAAQAETAEAGTAEAETAVEEPAAETAALPTRDADGFSISDQGEETERKQVDNGAEYEVIFAVRSGDQQLVEESSQRVRALIEETFQGAVDNVRASEVRRFAYPIKKQTEGVYVVVNARFQASHTDELDRFFKFEENVLRHMVLKIGG